MSKTFSLSLNNGSSSVSVSLILPQRPTSVPIPVPTPNYVYVPPAPNPPPPNSRPSGMVEFTEPNSSSIFTVPSGVTSLNLIVLGGGGGGGQSYEDQYQAGGGGGEAGEYEVRTISVTPGQQLVISVGEGGAANGGRGGTTVVRDNQTGRIISDALGGAGGKNASKNTAGAGGSTVTIQPISIFGGIRTSLPVSQAAAGTNGSSGARASNNSALGGLAVGGNGAPSPLGGGGVGGGARVNAPIPASSRQAVLSGSPAAAPGAGGGGGGSLPAPNGTTISGGRGGSGYVKISF